MMKRPGSLLLALTAAFSAVIHDGCFTEVGNAEDENRIRADFSIDYTRAPVLPKGIPAVHDTVRVESFYLLVREAEYHLKGGRERHLWRESDSGLPVDFTGGDPMAGLPMRPIEPDSILDFALECRLPAPPMLSPDTVEISTFRQIGYIRGTYASDGDSIPFLFALPTAEYLDIKYPPSVVATWRKGNGYEAKVVFYALKWVGHAGLGRAVRSRDRSGRAYILIDARHNSALHRTLSESFLTSFNSTQVESG